MCTILNYIIYTRMILKFITNALFAKKDVTRIDRSRVDLRLYHFIIPLYKCVQWNTPKKSHRFDVANFQVIENLFPNCWQSYHRCVAGYLAFSINSIPQRSRKNEGSMAAAGMRTSRE